jgi:3-methylfumaryl-CoA hydratase
MTASMDTVAEVLTEGPAHALAGLLPGRAPDLSEPLPLLWHWVYLLDRPSQHDLGPDGHPRQGSVQSPPEPGLRRMWAGGRVRCPAPLRLGEPAVRRSSVTAERHKQGRAGAMIVRTLTHKIEQRGVVVVHEEQDVIYLTSDQAPMPARAPATTDAADRWDVEISATLMFRFSALTYNAHRIHYDRDYARDVEGYPGLLVHGPLQALLMAEIVRCTRETPHVNASFDYRLVAPLFDNQGCTVRVDTPGQDGTASTTVCDSTGRVTARGTLTVNG